jgi:hypothetical protein
LDGGEVAATGHDAASKINSRPGRDELIKAAQILFNTAHFWTARIGAPFDYPNCHRRSIAIGADWHDFRASWACPVSVPEPRKADSVVARIVFKSGRQDRKPAGTKFAMGEDMSGIVR